MLFIHIRITAASIYIYKQLLTFSPLIPLLLYLICRSTYDCALPGDINGC